MICVKFNKVLVFLVHELLKKSKKVYKRPYFASQKTEMMKSLPLWLFLEPLTPWDGLFDFTNFQFHLFLENLSHYLSPMTSSSFK